MGSLGQVEGVQMESRQETPAALTVEEKGLGKGREKRMTEGRAYCNYFSLGEKVRSYMKKSSRRQKREKLHQGVREAMGI